VECLHEDEHGALVPPTAGLGAVGVDDVAGASQTSPPCIGDGTSGERVRAIYARPADRVDRYDEVVEQIRGHAAEVSEVYRESAAQTGGEREVRWFMPGCVDGEGGELQVDHVVLSSAGDESAAATRAELRALGYTNDERKYLVWMDSDVICGAGYIFRDDGPDPATNANSTFATVGRIDSGLGASGEVGGPETECWGFAEAHELGHLLGAVQASYETGVEPDVVVHPGAPHATPGFHCTDEWDVMCGDDGGGSTPVEVTYPCGGPEDEGNDVRLDCGHDDYFHTSPEPESYLATHWNVADSPFLEGGFVPSPPDPLDPPSNDAWADATAIIGYRTSSPASTEGATAEDQEPAHAGEAADHSVWFRWDPPTDGLVRVTTQPESPAPFSGAMRPTVQVYEGVAFEELVPVPGSEPPDAAGHQTAATFTVSPGATYWIAVDDWDQQAGAFTLVTGPPANTFTDVDAASDEAVDWMTAVAITEGYPDGTYRPATTLNRQQIAAFLYRLAGQPHFQPPVPPARTTFKDVRTTHAFYREIEWLATQGITTGYPDGTYRSNVQLNRQQIATFLYRTAEATSTSTAEPFTDVKPGHAFHRQIAWAYAQGIMDGTTATTFGSNTVMTRAALADAMHRLAGRAEAWEDEPPPTVWFPTSP
jgi:hypothetical protein